MTTHPSAPVETKVTAASLGSLGAGIALAVLMAVMTPDGQAYLAGMPPVVVYLLVAALPPIMSFLAGFAAPHTARYAHRPPG